MAVNLSAASCDEHALTRGEAALMQCLEHSMAELRPVHPVSLLDLSPRGDTGLAMAMALRHERRKIRIMTYEWLAPKHRERRPGVPDVLVERGRLPGLHFSTGSFDYLVGLGVLSAVRPEACCKLLMELRRIAMRRVILIEETEGYSGIREGELKDLLLESGCAEGRIDVSDVSQNVLCLML